MTHRAIYLFLFTVLGVTSAAQTVERIASSAELDIELMKTAAETVEELGDAATTKLDEYATKLFDSKKKESVEKKLEGYKGKLLSNDAFYEAFRCALRDEYRITDELIEKSSQMDVETIEEELRDVISKRLKKKFPLSLKESMQKKAESRYPHHKIGDNVKVVIRRRTISGRLNALSTTHATIGTSRVPLKEISPQFNIREMEKFRAKYVKKHYFDKRTAYHQKLKENMPERVYAKYGYTLYRDNWISAKELAEQIDQTLQDKKEKGKQVVARREQMTSRLKWTAIIGGVFLGLSLIIAVGIRIVSGKR